ncbi:hypothetical protein Desor_3766 [Desulfosporosinus orientis DSM 765]|uniref:Uncharacterized protein n=1 Tax=Desulfosporosinus orientis (strain ATCC 19365 / DSM 765 / NCIMB 8382 / VKM B-1628 / Singapore I) TaxID=768706 RepID=G7W6U6_DESOD|nr:hypothetical protein Desor_3766 [Desulfosporosinus orientis DSM 765]
MKCMISVVCMHAKEAVVGIEQPANALYLVLPTMLDELSDEALENVADGDSRFTINCC